MAVEVDHTENMAIRSIWLRALCAVAWFVLIYFAVAMLIGGLVGVFASNPTESNEAAYAAGRAASEEFFAKYIWFVITGVIGLVGLLSWFEILPGTNRVKDPTHGVSARWFASPSWLRYSLTMVIVLLAASLWGFLASLSGIPGSIVGLVAVIIAPVILVALNKEGK